MRKIPCENCITLALCKNKIRNINWVSEMKCESLYNYLKQSSPSDITKIRKFFDMNSSGEKHKWFEWRNVLKLSRRRNRF
jgi:hypothetical protein